MGWVVSQLNRTALTYEDYSLCHIGNGVEDPRLFKFQDKVWVAANGVGHRRIHANNSCRNSMLIFETESLQVPQIRWLQPNYTELQTNNVRMTWGSRQEMYVPEAEQRTKGQGMFDYRGKLYTEFTIVPRTVLEVEPDTGNSFLRWINRSLQANRVIPVGYNELRGSASSVEIPTPSGLHWSSSSTVRLNLAHTNGMVNGRWDYIHFWYIFEAHPPFRLLAISSPVKFRESERPRIQYAAGISYEGDRLLVSYGDRDCGVHISTFALTSVWDLMFRVAL